MRKAVLKRVRTRLSPWVTVVERSIDSSWNQNVELYHSLEQADYVSVLAITEKDQVPLVHQFRPALERITLELPGGLLDNPGSPEETARNELYEETGFKAPLPLVPLGCLDPDTGRLENRMWGFLANQVVRDDEWCAEDGIETVLMSKKALKTAIVDGEFTHALHIALIGLAVMRGLF